MTAVNKQPMLAPPVDKLKLVTSYPKMDAWAAKYGQSAAFICVCCAGPSVATQFGNELKLQHCHNTWVDEDDMPSWGQLGCNGFIVVDGADVVVCKASPAFLEVKQAAFRHVETLLDALIGAQPAPKLMRGRVDASVGGACARVRFGADGDGPAEDAAAEGEAARAEEPPATVADVQAIRAPSVHVDVLDAEHAACEAKLKLLGRLTEPPGVGGRPKQIEAALRALLAAYEAHFAHEEALLDEHLYAAAAAEEQRGAAAAGFSAERGARTSHYADHKLMLDGVRRLLADVPSVDAADVLRLATDFERHATSYDGAYADKLSAAMAQAGKPVAVA